MVSWRFFLAAVLLSCVLVEVSSITIGNLFGSTRTELSHSESEEDSSEETKKKDPHHKPPKIPVPAIPKPVIPKPVIPKPAEVPHKHKKPIKHQEIITATKTVFVEVTSRVTTHPVCVAVYGIKPPCLPYIPHHHYLGKDNLKDHEEDYDSESLIEPSAVVQAIEPTRILDSVSLSEQIEELESAEVPIEGDEEGRSGRYLEVGIPTPSVSLKSTGEIDVEPESKSRFVDELFHKAPLKHYTTKTLWVTKVEKLIDYRVTATLEAKNCIPVDLQIPLCSSPHKVYAPGYSPNHGVYVEGQTGSHHITNNEHHLVSGLTNLFGINKLPKPFAHHKPSNGHIVIPAVHKPVKVTHKPKPLVKPVPKPGIVNRDEIKDKDSEAPEVPDVPEAAEAVPADTTVEREVEVQVE